jgi:hypothetical protein
MCFASAFFQLIMGLMGVPGLCSFIVAYRVGVVRFMFVYFHMRSFCIMFLFCFSICFIIFLVFLCWVAVDFCNFVLLYEVIYFLFIFS